MARPYVCVACRLRWAVRAPSNITSQQRQRLSQTARPSHQGRHSSFLEDTFAPTQSLAEISLPLQQGLQPAGNDRNQRSPQGRYSGRILRPDDLLDQLDRSRVQESRGKRGSFVAPDRSSRVGTDRTPGRPFSSRQHKAEIPGAIWKKYSRLAQNTHDDKEAWNTLLEILHACEKTGFPPAKLGRNISSIVTSWAVRTSKCWLRHTAQKMEGKLDLEYANVTGKEEEARIRAWSSVEPPPSPSLVMAVSTAFGIEAISPWCDVLWQVAIATVEMRIHLEASKQASEGYSEGFESVQACVRELLSIWNLCMRATLSRDLHRQRSAVTALIAHSDGDKFSHAILENWSFLPSLQSRADIIRRQRLFFDDVLHMLVPSKDDKVIEPKFPNESAAKTRDYLSSAFVTLDLLRTLPQTSHSPNMMADLKEYQPWARVMENIFQYARAPTLPALLNGRMKQSQNEEIRKYYEGLVNKFSLHGERDRMALSSPSSHEALNSGDASRAETTINMDDLVKGTIADLPSLSVPQDFTINTKDLVLDRFVNLSIRRLSTALKEQSSTAAKRVLREIDDFAASNPSSKLPLELYEHLMLTFLSLRNGQFASDVWARLIASGQQPTSKTYTIMMRGCQHIRDLNGMEAFWGRMRQVGIQPDAYGWSTRIFGLFRSGRSQQGMKALNEMGHEWIAAAKVAHSKDLSVSRKTKDAPEIQPSELVAKYSEDVNSVSRPNLIVMNSAISALGAKDDFFIPQVLAWGRFFNLEPDIITYNVLLNITMRHGVPDEAIQILSRMDERGVKANSTTWTVLLTAMFAGGFVDGLAPAEQTSRVMDFIKGIEGTNKTGIDQKSYALVIDRLLKTYNNPSAAQTVLAHMTNQGIQPTAYIYTILMTSYFQQTPPDITAVESLWTHIQSRNADYGVALDSVFYDRIIEGYATHHQHVGIAPMFSFLTRMESEGKKPSWRALVKVAHALAERNEWERLASVVNNVRGRLRQSDIEAFRPGQVEFWQFVIETGLLKTEGITTVDQILQEGALHRQRMNGMNQGSQ